MRYNFIPNRLKKYFKLHDDTECQPRCGIKFIDAWWVGMKTSA